MKARIMAKSMDCYGSRKKTLRKSALRTVAAGLSCLAMTLPGLGQTAKAASVDQAQVAHGEYLVKDVAGCGDCHTPRNNKGEPIIAQWLNGSKLSFAPLVPMPGFADTTPQIAGLEQWDAENAVRLLMTGLDPTGHRPRPPMPQYRMNHTDAVAVVEYLRSLK